MKSLIMYYYNFNNINIEDIKDRIVVKYKNEIYELIKINNIKEIHLQYNLTKGKTEYDQIMLNKDKNITTKYNDDNYVLIKKIKYPQNILNNIIKNNKLYYIDKEYVKWPKLWSYKCDYIEEQYNNIRDKYPLIDESIDYYIGMTETAINYYNYNIKNTEYNELYIVHKRITYKDFNNPINISIDIKERDYSEYLKMIFFTKDYLNINIQEILNEFNLTKENSIKLISRLLYPSYYYDMYEKIIIDKYEEKELKNIIIRIEEYENYIKKIYTLINQSIELPYIDWL